jgi:hypothetical protein
VTVVVVLDVVTDYALWFVSFSTGMDEGSTFQTISTLLCNFTGVKFVKYKA